MPFLSLGFEPETNKELLSANRRARLKRFSVESLMYIRNKSSPKSDTCGTPANVVSCADDAELILTFCFLDDKKFAIQHKGYF